MRGLKSSIFSDGTGGAITHRFGFLPEDLMIKFCFTTRYRVMHKLIPPCFFLALILAAQQVAAAGGRWYVGGLIGAPFSVSADTSIPSIAGRPPLTSQPVFTTGYDLALRFGYLFQSHIRLEGQVGYQNVPMSKINNAIGANTVTPVSNSYTSLLSALLNAYYNFDLNSRFVPYVGIGAGVVRVNNMIKPTAPIPVAPGLFFTRKELNYDTFGYQGLIGLMYQVSNNWNAALEYQYFSTLNNQSTGQTNLGPDSYQTNQRVSTNTIAFSLNYLF